MTSMASSLSGNGEGSSVKHASGKVDPGDSGDEEDSLNGNDRDGALLQEDFLMEESPARSVTHVWSAGFIVNPGFKYNIQAPAEASHKVVSSQLPHPTSDSEPKLFLHSAFFISPYTEA